MTREEIRQKAIECRNLRVGYCHSHRQKSREEPCTVCEYHETYADCMTIFAYEHGFADGIEGGEKQMVDKARIGAEAIDEYVRRLCERCMQSENDCQKCPFADNGCQIVEIAKQLKGEQT